MVFTTRRESSGDLGLMMKWRCRSFALGRELQSAGKDVEWGGKRWERLHP